MEQHIGLGASVHDISLDIWWPTTRTQQHFTGVVKDQYIETKEFATSYTKLERHPFKLGNNEAATATAAAKKAN
jgi:hypothetical protein